MQLPERSLQLEVSRGKVAYSVSSKCLTWKSIEFFYVITATTNIIHKATLSFPKQHLLKFF